MSTEQGRRWLAAGMGWREGMLTATGWRLTSDPYERGWACAARPGVEVAIPLLDSDGGPDFDDAATRGVALEMVRERLGEPTAYLTYDASHGEWSLVRNLGHDEEEGLHSGGDWGLNGTGAFITGPTEADALVAAAEAAQ